MHRKTNHRFEFRPSFLNRSGQVNGSRISLPVTSERNQRPRTSAPAKLGTFNATLQSKPETRAEAVDRAKFLVHDPNYPSPAVLEQVAQLLAQSIS